MARRRSFFERRDGGWRTMLPYRTAERLVEHRTRPGSAVTGLRMNLLHAINRGEGLSRPERSAGQPCAASSASRTRHGASYRLFPLERFTLRVEGLRPSSPLRRALAHRTRAAIRARGRERAAGRAVINLDVFEMLVRLNEGYRPSVEEMQGYLPLPRRCSRTALNAAALSGDLLTTHRA